MEWVWAAMMEAFTDKDQRRLTAVMGQQDNRLWQGTKRDSARMTTVSMERKLTAIEGGKIWRDGLLVAFCLKV